MTDHGNTDEKQSSDSRMLAALILCGCDVQHIYRVSASALHVDSELTAALGSAGVMLPANITALHCYPRQSDWLASDGLSHVQCDVELTGRAVRDTDKNSIAWQHAVYENPNEPRDPLRNRSFDTRTMLDTQFNFSVSKRADGSVMVATNVNKSKITFSDARAFIVATARVLSKDASEGLANAERVAPDTVRATWPSKSEVGRKK